MKSVVSVCGYQLSRKIVQNIHLEGGSLLGVSRGGARTTDIVDSLEKKGINMLFVLGGNGTHAGALAIHNEVKLYLISTLSFHQLLLSLTAKLELQF